MINALAKKTIPGNEQTQTLTDTQKPLVTANGDFDISTLFAPDKYSTSQNGSVSTGTNNSSGTSSSSGLDSGTRDKITNATLPGLTASTERLSALPGQMTEEANNLYRSQTRSAMEELLPKVMEQLSGGKMQKSSVGSDTLSKGMAEIAKGYGEKGYQSKIDQAQLEMALPQILSGILQMTQFSEGKNTSNSTTQSSGDNMYVSNSLTENKGEPYDRGLELLKTMLGI